MRLRAAQARGPLAQDADGFAAAAQDADGFAAAAQDADGFAAARGQTVMTGCLLWLGDGFA
jgi:hypothetical protein